ncbi:MAG: lantibiotic dehydratase [Gallionellaceae bacterium]|nr:lantibiotic dehydratase [Gallionellaceae bacterium]
MGVLTDSPILECYEGLLAELNKLEAKACAIAKAQSPGMITKLERRFSERSMLNSGELTKEIRDLIEPILAARNAILTESETCMQHLLSEFQIETQKARQRLLDFLVTGEAQEALFLSNPESLQRISALIESGTESMDSRVRQRLRLGWSYTQRLCAKNDTCSFFGPIAWGRFVDRNQPSIKLDLCENPWLSLRKTFFEHWVVQRLTQAVNADPTLHNYLPVSISSGCYVENGALHFPLGKTQQLGPLATCLLSTIEAVGYAGMPREQIVARIKKQDFLEADINASLEFFLCKKILASGLRIAPGLVDPLGRLSGLVSQLDAPREGKTRWISLLFQLEELRSRFETGDLDARVEALNMMRTLLSNVRIDLTRAKGEMYVGRSPIYEDCSRNLHIELGGHLACGLKADLEPVMKLYCWLAQAVAVRLHDRYLACWRSLQPEGSCEAAVDFLSLFSLLNSQDNKALVVTEICEILQKCWDQIAAACCIQSDLILGSEDIDLLLDLLKQAEPRVGWVSPLGTDIHSPDFMLAAKDIAALERGDYLIVLGEVHPAVHTVSQPVAQPFCKYAEEVRNEVEQLLYPFTLIIADSPETYQRSHIDWLDTPSLMQLVLPNGNGRVADTRILPSGRGEVFLKNGILIFRDPKYGIEQDLLTVIPSEMHRVCFALAGDLIGQNESRRITVGRVILKRRYWHVPSDLLPDARRVGEKLDSYLSWRHWATGMGMPRYVFVKCENEPKPIFVDFYNPLALDLLAGLAKKKTVMRFSEMRPDPDELWLTDSRGRYSCEFRTSYVSNKPSSR